MSVLAPTTTTAVLADAARCVCIRLKCKRESNLSCHRKEREAMKRGHMKEQEDANKQNVGWLLTLLALYTNVHLKTEKKTPCSDMSHATLTPESYQDLLDEHAPHAAVTMQSLGLLRRTQDPDR